MKKFVCLILVLLFLLFSTILSYAEEGGTIDLTEAHAFETVNSLCFIEDTLYILGSYGIYEYKNNELKTIIDLTHTYKYRHDQQRPDDDIDAVWDKIVGYLFTDGQVLYGMHPYTGQIFKIENAQLNVYTQIPAGLLYAEKEEFFREIKGITYAGEKLALLFGTDTYDDCAKTEVVLVDLKAQKYHISEIKNVQSISAGTDGKLLFYVEADQAAIWQYDIATDTLEKKLVQIEEESAPSGMAEYMKDVVYLEESKVKLIDENGNALVKAYMPIQNAHVSTPSACSKDGLYAYPYYNYVFLRNIGGNGEATQTVLTLMGSVPARMIIDFTIQNPNIAVVTMDSMNPNELIQAAVSRDSGIDLFVLPAPGDYCAMKDKGYISPLNTSDKLIDEAEKLYPAIQEAVFRDDLLLGYPISVRPKTWMVNETKWNELELGEYPTTYEELFAKIDMWLNEYALDYPEYVLSDIQQMGISGLVLSMVEEYIHVYGEKQDQLSFDTPVFKKMLQSVSQNEHLFSEENDQWGMPLLTSTYFGFGTSYTDGDINKMILPPTIDSSEDQALYADLDILSVSMASNNIEEAIQFVEFCAINASNATRYEMMPALVEPIESITYQMRITELKEELNDMVNQLEHAEGSVRFVLEEKVQQTKMKIELLKENKWEISPDSIEIYRDVAKNLDVSYRSPLLIKGKNGGYDSLQLVVNKYCAEELRYSDIEALITELDRVTKMVYYESI